MRKTPNSQSSNSSHETERCRISKRGGYKHTGLIWVPEWFFPPQNKECHTTQSKPAWYERIRYILELVYFLIAGPGLLIAAVYAASIAIEALDSASIQATEMTIQSKIAAGQFKVAMKQLKEMQSQRIMDERAWCSPVEEVTAMKSDLTFPGVTNFNCTVTFKNTGRTPANKVLAWVAWFSGIPPKKNDFHKLVNSEFPPQAASIASGGTIDCDTERGLSEFEIQNARAGVLYFVYGAIQYEDVFKTNHISYYCFQMQPDLKTFKGFRGLEMPEDDDAPYKP